MSGAPAGRVVRSPVISLEGNTGGGEVRRGETRCIDALLGLRKKLWESEEEKEEAEGKEEDEEEKKEGHKEE